MNQAPVTHDITAGGKVVGRHIVHPDLAKEMREHLKTNFPDHHAHAGLVHGRFRVLKFRSDEHAEKYKASDLEKQVAFHETGDLAHLAHLTEDELPEEIAEFSNGFLNTGINEIWSLIQGTHTNLFSNANSQIGVGDSSTSFSASQTDLQASTNKTYQACDSTYPSLPGSQNILFQATFGGSSANYAWNEMVAKNNASSICIDRAVQSLGTKASGTSWVAQLTLSMS